MYRHRLDQEPPPSRSRFSVRVTVLGAFAVALFGLIFLRLWYLQVLSGDSYRSQADDNRTREIRVQAPRGQVLDREGRVLVSNRTAMALQLDPTEMPTDRAARTDEMRRIAAAVDMRLVKVKHALAKQQRVLANSPATIKQDLSPDEIYYLREHQVSFPGVNVARVFIRQYNKGTLAAHLFGNVGEVTAEQLAEPRYGTLQQGDVIGQSGIEYEYDRFLRGRPGKTEIQVDALGRPKGQVRDQPAEPGDNVRLTLDARLQSAGEAALGAYGLPGAFVAEDISDGDILAMGSAPTFDPGIFTRPISNKQYHALTSKKNDAPLANRAIQGLYPTGSVFKMITAVAALEHGLITPDEIVYDTGELKLDVLTLHNAGDQVYGAINLSDALKVSSDIYFYKLGIEAPAKGDGGLIQDWSRDLGLGANTDIDLPAENAGLIPTPAWRNELYRHEDTDRPWTLGDNVNLAVGQGDLQATPLQMVNAYAALANGGEVLRPHIVDRVEDVGGEVLQEVRPPARRQLDIDDGVRNAILEGMHRAAQEPGGTSYPVFGNFTIPVAGKTGTAERGVLKDQSWYVVLAPYPNPEIAVAVTVEEGGFGVDSAAPVAMKMLARYFDVPAAKPIPVPEQASTVE